MNDVPPELLQKFTSDAAAGQPNIQPKDASTLILLDRSGPSPKVLMGKRHQRHTFLPGAFVFPGGSVDAGDRNMPVAAALDPRAEEKLMRQVRRPSGDKARSLALAAIRETFEETGLLLGARRDAPLAARGRPSPKPASIPTSPAYISSLAPSPRPGGSAATTPASSPPTPVPSLIRSRARSAPISS